MNQVPHHGTNGVFQTGGFLFRLLNRTKAVILRFFSKVSLTNNSNKIKMAVLEIVVACSRCEIRQLQFIEA